MVLYLEGEFVLSLSRMLMFGVEAIPTHCIDVNSPPTSAGPLILQKLLGEYLYSSGSCLLFHLLVINWERAQLQL